MKLPGSLPDEPDSTEGLKLPLGPVRLAKPCLPPKLALWFGRAESHVSLYFAATSQCGHSQHGIPRESSTTKMSETGTLQGSQGGSPVSILDSRIMGQGLLSTVPPSPSATDSSSGLCFINSSPEGSRIGKAEGNS